MLSDNEWELMKILWKNKPLPAAELAAQLPQWHIKTVRTMLLRLQKKGIVKQEPIDGIQHFMAVLSKEDCESRATDSFIQRVFDGALSPMVAHFTRQHSLSPKDRDALLKILRDTENKGDEQ